MARTARLVIPDHPHHVIQRGVRRMDVFHHRSDYEAYIKYVQEGCQKADATILAYCLMPNHVHFVIVPKTEDGLRLTLANAHRRYTRMINIRQECTGHLWQERFQSFPMDESHLLSCVRYVELNPVRAGLVSTPEQWLWSSANAHLSGENDKLVMVEPLLQMVPDWTDYLDMGIEQKTVDLFNKHNSSGFPVGQDYWINKLENDFDRRLRAINPGRNSKKLYKLGTVT